MSLLTATGVSFRYVSGSSLFDDASFSINPGDRTAIVGPNGAGKSTLLQIIAGRLQPTRGSIIRRQHLVISIAAQEVVAADAGDTLFEFVLQAQSAIAALRANLHSLELRLADPESVAASEYASRVNEYQEQGGFTAEADVARILTGLGFSDPQFDLPLHRLSGGERTRAALARALSMPSDLLLLDEPTNHLDIGARQWLERSLSTRAGACLVTSHDRAFLRAFALRFLEIDRAKVRIFVGGYDDYRRSRGLIERQQWAEYKGFERRRQAVEAAAERRDQLAHRVATPPPGVRSSQDYYARKAAKVQRTGRILRERVTVHERVDKPWEEQPIPPLFFDVSARSGDLVLIASGISKSFGPRVLFRSLTLHVRRGERLVIAGPNGCGKTTLLNILRGEVAPDAGSVRMGANVMLGSVTQDGAELDPDETPLQICGTDFRSRTFLACLKLRPDCLNRRLRALSAGERTKVALAKISTGNTNVLLLDEPTNNLEIEAQEALEQALACYKGALVIVSHDRAFLEALGPEITVVDLNAAGSPTIIRRRARTTAK